MKTYRVTGSQPVYDTPPGGTFTRDVPPDYEHYLVASGIVEVVDQGTRDKKETATSSSTATRTKKKGK